jgi:hypothetical protein
VAKKGDGWLSRKMGVGWLSREMGAGMSDSIERRVAK